MDSESNQIQTLPGDILINLTELKSIDLFHNVYLTIPNEALELEALQEIYIYTDQNISEISTIDFRKSNLKLLDLHAFLDFNIRNDTFQNFAYLPLQVFDFYVYNYPGDTYTVEKGVFAQLSYVIEMGIDIETLPAIGSVSGPLQNLTLPSFYDKSLTYVNKTTLQVLYKFNSALLHLTIQMQSLLLRIEDYSFIWTPNLVTLNLGNNAINYLAKYCISGNFRGKIFPRIWLRQTFREFLFSRLSKGIELQTCMHVE